MSERTQQVELSEDLVEQLQARVAAGEFPSLQEASAAELVCWALPSPPASSTSHASSVHSVSSSRMLMAASLGLQHCSVPPSQPAIGGFEQTPVAVSQTLLVHWLSAVTP